MRPFASRLTAALLCGRTLTDQCATPVSPPSEVYWRLWRESLPPDIVGDLVVGDVGEECSCACTDRSDRIRVRCGVGVARHPKDSSLCIEGHQPPCRFINVEPDDIVAKEAHVVATLKARGRHHHGEVRLP